MNRFDMTPASAFQPEDVSGPSEVIDHASYPWRAADWRGRPWQEAVIVEAHVGTFTKDGSYRAMIKRLDHLVETGVTFVEVRSNGWDTHQDNFDRVKKLNGCEGQGESWAKGCLRYASKNGTPTRRPSVP